jgi:hypothetical protein
MMSIVSGGSPFLGGVNSQTGGANGLHMIGEDENEHYYKSPIAFKGFGGGFSDFSR